MMKIFIEKIRSKKNLTFDESKSAFEIFGFLFKVFLLPFPEYPPKSLFLCGNFQKQLPTQVLEI